MITKLGQNNPRPEQNLLMGSKVMQGSPEVIWGQIAQESPMMTKFGQKNPRPEQNFLMGSKVMQGSPGVKLL